MRLLLCPQKVTIVSVRQDGMRAAPHFRHRMFDILSTPGLKSQCRYVGKDYSCDCRSNLSLSANGQGSTGK
jgi:hypothetical protein